MKKNFFLKFFLIFDQKKMLFFFAKKKVKKFLSNDQNFVTKFFFGKSIEASVSLIEKHYVDKKLKHLKKYIIFQIFWIFLTNFVTFFSKEFTAEKFLWNLTLEKFSIFYQSLRDYNCGSDRCISPRLGKHFRKFLFVADCISGYFMKIWILLIFSIYFSSVSTNVDCGFTQMWVGDMTPKNGNFERLSPV